MFDTGHQTRHIAFMHDDTITVLTARGQTSIPSRFRRQARLKAGQRLHWEQISDTEFRVAAETHAEAPGPLAVLGWARRFHRGKAPRTDEVMKALREGDGE